MHIVESRALFKSFQPRKKNVVYAVHDASLAVRKGETLGLVGESGCGKSTLGKMLLNLEQPTKGNVFFDGEDITHYSFSRMRPLRNRMQMVFQGSANAFNPYFTVKETVGEPLRNYSTGTEAQKAEIIVAMLERVGLDASYLTRYAHELSGGQRQRVGIARALIVQPEFVVCDEVVSSVDYALKRHILALFADLKQSLALTCLFISHDIAAVNAVSDRVAVMYLGNIVELVPRVNETALHPYTRTLLAAALPQTPRNRKKNLMLFKEGEGLAIPDQGCIFQKRCLFTEDVCKTERPVMRDMGGGRHTACHLCGAISTDVRMPC
jgi:oligopeptide/dipeptide ABC transporter, ATP-binding protein, C-terminal domain